MTTPCGRRPNTARRKNFGAAGAATLLEEKRFPASTVDSLKSGGHDAKEQATTSGLQAIGRAKPNPASGGGSGWFGAADPRREGVVRGAWRLIFY